MHGIRDQNEAARAIRALAKRHKVSYTQTANDVLAHHMTRLSGDDVVLDEIERLLIALQRAGHLSRIEVVRLQASYLRQANP
jgi:hypothetical protein